MKTQSINWPFICLLAWTVLAGESAQGQVRGPDQSQMKITNAPAAKSEDGVDQHWWNAPLPDLLKAAESGDARAQYAYWVRESTLARQEPDRLSKITSSNFYHLSAEEQSKFIDEEKRTRPKWEAASESELRQAAQSGDMVAAEVLANRMAGQSAQRGVAAFAWLEKSAVQRFAPAEFDASMHYLWQAGWNIIPLNQEKGLELLRRAASDGLAQAQYLLGMFCRKGEMIPPDLEQALENFRKAADQGGPRSQYELATFYASGIGEPRGNYETPFALLLKSARAGYNLALHGVAEHYRTGIGAPMDYVEATRYYLAADKADQEGRESESSKSGMIFKVLDENLQPRRDLEEVYTGFARVMSAYLMATRREDASAMCQLGDWYLAGRYVTLDKVEACRWYNLAAGSGMANAAGKRERVRALLSQSESEEALKPPKAFQPVIQIPPK